MKKLIIITLFALLAIVLLAVYAKSFGSEEKSKQVEKQNIISLRFGHNTPVESALHQGALRFASLVENKTQGKVQIAVFPAQELGDDLQMVEMARNGELDIVLTPTAKMSIAVPSMQYADLPFYFPSRQDLYDMLDGEPGEMILNDLKPIGLYGVTFWENGFKHFTANTPLLSPDDFKDKNIRIIQSRIIQEQFESFGAHTITIDFHETKKALMDKVIDGQENPLVAIVSMGFHEVQTDLTLSEHAYLGYVFSFSEASLMKLPIDIRNVLIESAREVTPWEREETRKRETEFLKTIENAGVRIHTLAPKQRLAFSKLVAHIPEQFEPIIGVDVLSKTKELLYEKYGAFLNHEDHLLLGIDIDASMGGKLAALEIKRGVELAVSEINAQGGILSKPLVAVLKDHKIMPARGVRNIKEFASNPNLVAIIGGQHSAVVSEEIKSIQELKIPYVIPWAVAATLVENGYDENYIFRLSANDADASKFIAESARAENKKIAIMVENSLWGRENLVSMKKYLSTKAKSISHEVIYNRGQENFKSEIDALMASGAEVIILVADSFEGSKILQEVAKREEKITFISHWGIVAGDFFEENKKALQEIDLKFFQTFSFSKSKTQESQVLLQKYKERYRRAPLVDHAVAQAYDATHVLALAIQKANSSEGVKVKAALEGGLVYDGALKRYNPVFKANNHEALSKEDYYMLEYFK